jgi:hypothetical protein
VILFAFDIDGTLSTSAGPVKWDKVVMLHRVLAACRGGACGIVSPSAAWPRSDIPAHLPMGGGSRRANLEDMAMQYPNATEKVYVSNNNDQAEAAAAQFEYMTELEFARLLGD